LGLLKDALASNPDILHELLQRVVDFPLASAEDPASNRRFLLCEFNRHMDSYRSPFSDTYVPPLSGDDQHLPIALATFESHSNEVWDAYTQLYYGKEALGSVYVKEVANASFLACFLVQKTVDGDERLAEGQWNSAHIVHVGNVSKGTVMFRISSTISIAMDPTSGTCVSAQVTRETEEQRKVSDRPAAVYANHLESIGKMIESIEIDMRSNLDVVTIPKTREVLMGLRSSCAGGRPAGIPIMMARPPSSAFTKKKSYIPAGAVAMQGMGGAHAMALNAAVLKRAPKK
jgi:capping protein beta